MTDLNKLDREVAEVLGMEVLASVIMKGKTITRHWKHNGIKYHPSTNPAQAMELLTDLMKPGWSLRWVFGRNNNELHIYAPAQSISSIIGQGETIPIAICRVVIAAKNT